MDNNAKYYKKITTTEFTNGTLAIQETIKNSTEHKIADVHLVCIKDVEVVKEFFFTEEEVNIDLGLLEAGISKKYIQSLNYYLSDYNYYIQTIKEEILQDSHTLKRYRLKNPPSKLSFYCSIPNFGAISIYKDEEDWFLFQINLKNPLLHNQLFRCDGFLGLKKMIENLPL